MSEELKEQYRKETGQRAVMLHCHVMSPTMEYAAWLEKELNRRPAAREGEVVKLLGDAIILSNQIMYDLAINMNIAAEFHAEELVTLLKESHAPPEGGKGKTICQADTDGDCEYSLCPQLRDGEPKKSGRSCPLAINEDGNWYNPDAAKEELKHQSWKGKG